MVNTILQNYKVMYGFISIGIKYYIKFNRTTQRLKALVPFEIDSSSLQKVSLYAFLNHNLATNYLSLRDKRLCTKEVTLLDLMSLFVASFDDLMDEHHFTKEEIFNFLKSSKDLDLKEHSAMICKSSYLLILDRHPNLKLFEKYLNLGAEAQERDIQAKHVVKNLDQLKDIMFDKGGHSLLLILSVLQDFNEADQKAIYLLGAMIQFANDVFDIYKDTNAGEWTFATNLRNMDLLKSEYEIGLENCYDAWLTLGFDGKSLERFWIHTYALLSRGVIAINQYSERDILSKPEMHRSDWICDMERFENIMKNYKIVLNWLMTYQLEIEGD